ncbi:MULTISPECIES: Lrp/AsnC family transcriptional regulator [unclassified Marinobacterium]|jgi:DNA-binding Lrp family transcriptional regulator|uniref:Lrp/AsnC family transcriptional regulator n=1 Tax=unclassified Marinobacterium TaxID=2644139 RepID=UPI0015684DC1|nr:MULTISPECIES: Lrp/AsnC ligand binding domain-containing protein [unclassified Marinobacterium]NRP15290.1 AsnC family protein [Marinobacterium sp. xm-a-152]NRP26643.1 AsnC family protein [Marinobacterium sp. xm-d-420]NRP37650.1 AsnC family protein [Marinobacterium sp. xm-a-121]NRP52932.1 AsnC family protein [Marinobacterium sp. xm-v-242]NRP56526.1 AsnC family protein [Marinobacterium sp. xm-d-510]
MVTAIILLKVQRQKIQETATLLAGMEGFTEVFSVSGNFDLVAMARVENNEALSDLITNKLAEVDHIEETETMLAFKAYSKHDLEAMFGLGFE